MGLVSADFGDHPGGYHTLSVLRELKKKNFDLVAYSTKDRTDKLSPHFRSLLSTWHSIEKKNDEEVVEQLKDVVLGTWGYQLEIDLQSQTVHGDSGLSFHFEIDPFRKKCLLNGIDDIGLTLEIEHKIRKIKEQTTKYY